VKKGRVAPLKYILGMVKFEKLFIVDDDELFVYIAKNLLKELKVAKSIIDFPDGEDALKFFQDNHFKEFPDVIILDINMKRMNGWEFLDALRSLKISETIKIYISSSSIDPHDLERAKLNPYVNAFISKPLSLTKINDVLLSDL